MIGSNLKNPNNPNNSQVMMYLPLLANQGDLLTVRLFFHSFFYSFVHHFIFFVSFFFSVALSDFQQRSDIRCS